MFLFSVCFSISDFKNCTDMRENGTISSNAIYHLGRCLVDQKDFDIIQNNKTAYYACTYEDTEGKTLDGLYFNATNCGSSDKFPDNIFDIPTPLRKSGNILLVLPYTYYKCI